MIESQPNASRTSAGIGIAAVISATGRCGIPRKSIQAVIGAVIVNVTTMTEMSGIWLKGFE